MGQRQLRLPGQNAFQAAFDRPGEEQAHRQRPAQRQAPERPSLFQPGFRAFGLKAQRRASRPEGSAAPERPVGVLRPALPFQTIPRGRQAAIHLGRRFNHLRHRKGLAKEGRHPSHQIRDGLVESGTAPGIRRNGDRRADAHLRPAKARHPFPFGEDPKGAAQSHGDDGHPCRQGQLHRARLPPLQAARQTARPLRVDAKDAAFLEKTAHGLVRTRVGCPTIDGDATHRQVPDPGNRSGEGLALG